VSQPDQTLLATTNVAPAAAAAVPPKLCLSTSNFCSRFAIPLSAVLFGLGLVALTTVRSDEQTGVAKIRIIDDLCPRWLDAVESRVAGQVPAVAVEDFQRANKYDLLVQIDPADYQAQLDQAEAAIIGAQAALERLLNVGDAEFGQGTLAPDIAAIAQNDGLDGKFAVQLERSRLSARLKSCVQLVKKPTRLSDIQGLETFREAVQDDSKIMAGTIPLTTFGEEAGQGHCRP
jgi:membrane fusion protein, multidrug efflux system